MRLPMLAAFVACACAVPIGTGVPLLQADEPDAVSILERIEDRLKRNKNDAEAWQRYEEKARTLLAPRWRTDPETTLELAARIERFSHKNMPDDAAAQKRAELAGSVGEAFRWMVSAERTSLEALRNALDENPDQPETINIYLVKIQIEYQELVRANLKDFDIRLQKEESFVDQLRPRVMDREVQSVVSEIDAEFNRLRQMSDIALARTRLIGKPAPLTLDAVTWVNSSSMDAKDLEGNVVLLDFWAVFCAPCVAGFSDLRAWHNRYATRGLIIIGVSERYGYCWDDDSKSVTRREGDVSLQEEAEGLLQFGKEHRLPFSLVLQNETGLTSAFHVQSLPQLVLIDRNGTIRLVQVGHDKNGIRQMEDLIVKLIEEARDD